MDFFEFEKKKSTKESEWPCVIPELSPLQLPSDLRDSFGEPYVPPIPELSRIQLPSEFTDSFGEPYVPPIRKLKPKIVDIEFKPSEPGTLNPTVLFLDNSSSMLSLGREPPDSCKYYIQTLYDTAVKETNLEIREKLLNVNVRLIVFNEVYNEILNDSVRNLNKPNFDYSPVGMTDLYTPVYDVMMADPTPKDVVIISDGQNNSGPYRSEYMSMQFKKAMASGWSIKFVGCTLDAISESNKLNLRDQTYNCSDNNEDSIPIGSVMRHISHEISQTNRQRSISDHFDL